MIELRNHRSVSLVEVDQKKKQTREDIGRAFKCWCGLKKSKEVTAFPLNSEIKHLVNANLRSAGMLI